MDEGSPLYALFLFIAFVIVNAILYAFGAAVQNLNESEIEKKAEDGGKREARLLKYIEKPEVFISTIQLIFCAMAVVVGYFQLGVYSENVRRFFIGLGTGAYLNDITTLVLSYLLTALYLMLILIALGMYVPKCLGHRYPKQVSTFFVGIIDFLVRIFRPFTWIIEFFSNLILRIFGIDPKENGLNMTEEEIISIVNEGHEQGVLEEREAEMISNIIELDDKTAGDIMIHRKNIVAVDGEWTLDETVRFIVQENNSRYPVYLDNIDNIIGILHIKDVLSCYHENTYHQTKIKNLKELLRKPQFIPETRNIDDLFREMQMNKNHMVIVIDEYGQTAGIISMEDILEEIVGNILDEHDEEEFNVISKDDGTYIVKGLTPLEELTEELGIDFDEDDFDTLNGYMIAKLDRIPKIGETPEIQACDCTFRVKEVDGKKISLVEIIRNKQDSSVPV